MAHEAHEEEHERTAEVDEPASPVSDVANGMDAAEVVVEEMPVVPVDQPPVIAEPAPPIVQAQVVFDTIMPPHIVGKGFHDAGGTWRVVLPSGRIVALNNEYHGVTEHEDGSISIEKLVEIGPFVGKLMRGFWRIDHPEV